MTVARSHLVSAIIGAVVAALISVVSNFGALAQWTGRVDQHLSDIEARVMRIEDLVTVKPVALRSKP
jgi:hypothetical protein